MRQQILQEIKDSLNHMEETGIVEISILGKLNNLQEFLKLIKTKWVENPNTDGFYFYQAARNVELILGRMAYRFENSQIANDNPKIAEDSLILLPAINRVLEITETDSITPDTIKTVLKRTEELRKTAMSTKLIETLDSSRESMDIEHVRTQFSQLMKNLDITANEH